MKLPGPLIPGKLIKRYKRFLADVELEDGDLVTAHCANPGAMTGLKDPGIPVWLSESDNPKRKLPYSWELARVSGTLVGINTSLPNKIAVEAIQAGQIPELTDYQNLKTEVPYGVNSRIDILLSNDEEDLCYVEVKNVHLQRKPFLAEFPDAVTKRGAKHLNELANMVEEGYRAVTLYVVQRDDCQSFAVAGDIDPNYKKAYLEAREAGVETLCYSCWVTTGDISLNRPLEIIES